MKRLSVAMAGTGRFADSHIQRWLRMDGVEVVAVIGRDHDRAGRFAGRYGIRQFYSDLSKFRTEVPEFDILDVVTVPSAHIDIAAGFMDRCKGVLIEKPVDIDAEKARQFMHEAEKRGVCAGVVSQLKYGEAYRGIKKLVSNGALGSIIGFAIHLSNLREGDYYSCDGGWKDDPGVSGGGIMISQAIHRLNFAMGIMGYDIDEVFALRGLSRYARNVEESVSAALRMKDGSTGTLQATSLASVESDYAVFEGTEGLAITDFKGYRSVTGRTGLSLNHLFEAPSRETEEDLLYNQMGEFADMVRNAGGRRQNLVEAINDIVIINSIYESMDNGCPVRVKDIIHE